MKRLLYALIAITFITSLATADEVTLDVTKDTDIWMTDPDGNNGDWTWFDLRGGVGTEERARSLVAFDIGPVTGKTIEMALLRLYAIETEWGLPNGHAEIYRAAEAWDEMSVTWNNQPTGNKDIRYVQTLPAPVGTWAQLEVTDIVQSWADGSFDNHGFFLAAPEGTPEAFLSFAAKDTSDTEIHPHLYVTYSTGSIEEDPASDAVLDVLSLSTGLIEISCTAPLSDPVRLSVYDASGSMILNLDGVSGSSNYHFTWNPDNSGVYFVRLATKQATIVKRVVVIR